MLPGISQTAPFEQTTPDCIPCGGFIVSGLIWNQKLGNKVSSIWFVVDQRIATIECTK